ncbi:hypothetical protein AQJ27_00390 [Streptomyces olivochromogenes]|uniref:Uncharacterized protein n=1 Tax=Streptomyces olivochromogenes TaxID=1963 RepID=A0A250V6G3_STROL|nr:hypothetical protein AQJ27_00390 [Streptomyces olivochromogenes]GAX49646.1 hypothetical protein SO3561_01135 [Streptomyces olivochromogenes]
MAQRLAPDARIVYADNDPLVLAHARALLTSAPEGRTEPGVVSCSRWRPQPTDGDEPAEVAMFGGVGRKP